MTKDTFRTLIVLFPSGGWKKNVEMKLVTGKPIYHFPLAYVAVSAGRKAHYYFADPSLALLEMRLLLAYFVWNFDAELVSKVEPLFEDRFVARRGVLEIRVKPVQH